MTPEDVKDACEGAVNQAYFTVSQIYVLAIEIN